MEEVRAFVETSWKGPARQDGVGMWLIECKRQGIPITRQGFIHLVNGTQTQGTLMAMANAFHILKKPCSIRICIKCGHVQSAVQHGWHTQWQENGWKNAKGNAVKNAELWKVCMEKAGMHTYTVESGKHEYTTVMQDAVKKELKEWKRRKNNGKQ